MFRRCPDEDTDDSPAVDSHKKKMNDQDRWKPFGARLDVVHEIDNRAQRLTGVFQGLREVRGFSSGVFLEIDAPRLVFREGFAFDCADIDPAPEAG